MKIADTPPVHCAACYGAYTDRRHVDFEASYDGPIVEGGYAGEDGRVETHIPVSIDDLIICDKCLTDAARLIGLGDVERLTAQLADKERELAEKDHQLRNAGSEVQALKTVIALEKETGTPPRRGGRPATRKAVA